MMKLIHLKPSVDLFNRPCDSQAVKLPGFSYLAIALRFDLGRRGKRSRRPESAKRSWNLQGQRINGSIVEIHYGRFVSKSKGVRNRLENSTTNYANSRMSERWGSSTDEPLAGNELRR